MKRRNILAGLGGLAMGSGTLFGSGAFSSIQTERSITVETARDANAFLRLVENGPGGRSTTTDGQLRFAIPGAFEEEENSNDPGGVGTESVYRFSSDAGSDKPLFEIQNRGTQAVQIWGSQPREETEGGDKFPTVNIYDVDSGEVLTEDNRSEPLNPGGEQDDEYAGTLACGIQIDTHGVEARDESYQFNITIHAAADDQT